MKSAIYYSATILLMSCFFQACTTYTVNIITGHYNEKLYHIKKDYDMETAIWITHLARAECETCFYYSNLEVAVDFLDANDICILYADEFRKYAEGTYPGFGSRPYNLYFVALIDKEDLNQAFQIGWRTMTDHEIESWHFN